ncbi:MAG: alpha-glucosidase [Tenericutes bacterium]|nr:alpha-glucosidase [Mycoplasmatota bacterium]
MNKNWWKSAIIYQVTLSSFLDGNNDGIGDFIGLEKKIEYIKDLGANVIWVSPHYSSPMDDNGYDVSDFYQVNKRYGTLEDFKSFVKASHKIGIKVITDLVLNHTSDEHLWFQKASNPLDIDYQKYHDYYIWQKPKYKDGLRVRPTRWLSWFGGPTWDYVEACDEYYLHIFSKKMPDLNWRNKEVREEMKKVVNFWVDLGVDGFRVDAANHLEKNWDFPDGYPGYENFSSLPKHHDYIKEFGEEIFEPRELLTIGESGGASKEEALKYVGFDSKEFNLLIHFGHVWADTGPDNKIFNGKWAKSNLRVQDIKKSFQHWYDMLVGKGWNLIYWHNHDHPRIVSHYGNDSLEFREISAKMLAISLYFMPGTSITYQGEEIGMTNLLYEDINDFRDVEVFTEYKNFLERGATVEMALQALRDRSRDNARSPMQWNASAYAGFSKIEPFMKVNFNYLDINVLKESQNVSSVLNTYKFILNLRKEDAKNISYGALEFLDIENEENFVYRTIGPDKEYLILSNFTDKTIEVKLPVVALSGYEYFYSNSSFKKLSTTNVLKPYEAYVYIKKY